MNLTLKALSMWNNKTQKALQKIPGRFHDFVALTQL